MAERNDIMVVKQALQGYVGRKVRLTSKKGRKKSVVRQGVIESTYPSIFTIKLDNLPDDDSENRRVSFSYTDVITKSVELVIYKQAQGHSDELRELDEA